MIRPKEIGSNFPESDHMGTSSQRDEKMRMIASFFISCVGKRREAWGRLSEFRDKAGAIVWFTISLIHDIATQQSPLPAKEVQQLSLERSVRVSGSPPSAHQPGHRAKWLWRVAWRR